MPTVKIVPFPGVPGATGPQGPAGPTGATGPAGESGVSDVTEYVVGGGTNGTQPTFNGDPLFAGEAIVIGDLVHFTVNVDFDNITNFGTGQYYVTLPFNARNEYYFRGGHVFDASSSKSYAVSGNVNAGSSQLNLYSVASNGNDVAFTSTVPFGLDIADNFHISGTYMREAQ